MTLQAGKMYRASGVTVDTANDSVYVVEQFNHRVSKWNYTPGSFNFTLDAGQVTSIGVESGGTLYSVSDPVNISAPTLDIANPVNATAEVGSVDGSGTILTITVTNGGNGYDPNNLPTVVAPTSGTPAILAAVVSTPWGSNGDGTTGKGGPIGDGGPTDISLYRPSDIILDAGAPTPLLYVTDTFHNRVRAINSTTGAFTTSLGSGGFGTADFYHPAGIAINASNAVVFIADELNHRVVRYLTNTNTLINPSVLADPSTGSGLSFVRPHGVVYDVTANEFNVGDSLRSVISSYSTGGAFQSQYGTPGTTANNVNLFYPASGKGLLTGTTTTVFADTRNNAIKTMDDEAIAITTGTIAGTGDGQLYYPESVSAFLDSVNYVLAANTLNNRVEVYSNVSATLSFQTNFGSPF